MATVAPVAEAIAAKTKAIEHIDGKLIDLAAGGRADSKEYKDLEKLSKQLATERNDLLQNSTSTAEQNNFFVLDCTISLPATPTASFRNGLNNWVQSFRPWGSVERDGQAVKCSLAVVPSEAAKFQSAVQAYFTSYAKRPQEPWTEKPRFRWARDFPLEQWQYVAKPDSPLKEIRFASVDIERSDKKSKSSCDEADDIVGNERAHLIPARLLNSDGTLKTGSKYKWLLPGAPEFVWKIDFSTPVNIWSCEFLLHRVGIDGITNKGLPGVLPKWSFEPSSDGKWYSQVEFVILKHVPQQQAMQLLPLVDELRDCMNATPWPEDGAVQFSWALAGLLHVNLDKLGKKTLPSIVPDAKKFALYPEKELDGVIKLH